MMSTLIEHSVITNSGMYVNTVIRAHSCDIIIDTCACYFPNWFNIFMWFWYIYTFSTYVIIERNNIMRILSPPRCTEDIQVTHQVAFGRGTPRWSVPPAPVPRVSVVCRGRAKRQLMCKIGGWKVSGHRMEIRLVCFAPLSLKGFVIKNMHLLHYFIIKIALVSSKWSLIKD